MALMSLGQGSWHFEEASFQFRFFVSFWKD